MKILDNEILNSELQYHSDCIKIQMINNEVVAFTNHDEDLIINNIKYHACKNFDLTKILDNTKNNNSELEIKGILDHDFINHEDIIAGKYDNASVILFRYEHELKSEFDKYFAKFGEFKIHQDQFTVSLYTMKDLLSVNFNNLYSRECRANLNDNKCKYNITSNDKEIGIVYDIVNNHIFLLNNVNKNIYDNGLIVGINGKNQGVIRRIKSFFNNKISIITSFPYPVIIGDEFELIIGCNKTIQQCKERFNNVINFRGEPHLPGSDKILKVYS